MTRRELVLAGLTGAALAAGALPLGRVLTPRARAGGYPQSPRVTPFAQQLRVPPVIRPTSSTATTDVYDVTMRPALAEILPGRQTPVWTYNGIAPGPTFMTDRGRTVMVRQHNALSVPTSVHLHGGDVAPDSDGHPEDLVAPGATKTYVYPGRNEASTLWYHDHAIHRSGRNAYMGLAGMFLVSDELERSLPLPRGAFDVPLVIQDRLFAADGQLIYPMHDPDRPTRQGAFGDVILVNGVPMPAMKVARRRYRFRLLNGSDARVYLLSLSSRDPLTVIGSDGGLLPAPVETANLLLSMAERYEVVIDFSRYPVGRSVVLENRYESGFGDPIDPARVRQVMRFDVVEDAVDPSSVPAQLRPMPVLDEAPSVRTRTWEFGRRGGQWVINGLPWDNARIDARPALDSVEIWRFVNGGGGWVHPIHPHLVEFQILDRNGRPPRPYESGMKDTVHLGPNEEARVIMRFGDFRGRYAMHCHNLSHEDHDMMTQFEVV